MKNNLNEILGIKTSFKIKEDNNIQISSRSINNKSIFFAFQGVNSHASEYINDALNKGAELVIHDDRKYQSDKENIFYIQDLRKRFLKFLIIFYGINLKNFSFIGITGTNGKTTTSYFLYQMLLSLKKNAHYIGTIGYFSKSKIQDAGTTTPSIVDLMNYLKGLKPNEKHYIVMEVSSHALDQDRLFGLEFDTGAILNIKSDHLDYHQSITNYVNAKFKLARFCKSIIVNIDSNKNYKNLKLKYLSLSNSKKTADYFYKINHHKIEGSKITLTALKKKYILDTNIFLDFNIENFVFAISLLHAILEEFNIGDINVKNLIMPKGRTDYFLVNKKNIIIDYAHNPDAMENLLNEVNKKFDKLIVVFGCGGDRDKLKRPEMLNIACSYSDNVIFTSDNLRNETFKSIKNDASRGNEISNVRFIKDRSLAIKCGYQDLMDNDCLLILGKGHETTQEIKGRKIFYSDYEVVNAFN